MIPIADDLPVCGSTKIFQKLILRALDLNNINANNNSKIKSLIEQIEKTHSKIFMPFRMILHRLDRTKKQLDPFQKDLFQQIDGP